LTSALDEKDKKKHKIVIFMLFCKDVKFGLSYQEKNKDRMFANRVMRISGRISIKFSSRIYTESC